MRAVTFMSLLVWLASVSLVAAHRSACHRDHSCPADADAYVCGDLGVCTACPDNQYCVQRKSRRAAALQRWHSQPGPVQPRPAAAKATAPARTATRSPQPTSPSQLAIRPQSQTPQAAAATPTTHKARAPHAQAAQQPGDEIAKQWDAYEQQLQTYCMQVAPHTVRRCVYTELSRLTTAEARQRAQKYAPRPARR